MTSLLDGRKIKYVHVARISPLVTLKDGNYETNDVLC